MKATLITLVSLIALTILYFVCFAVASATFFSGTAQPAGEQANAAIALLAVSFLNTAVLYYLIRRSRVAGWKLVAGLFVVFFGVATVMGQIESAFFLTRLPPGFLPRIFLTGASVAALFSPLAVLVLKLSTRDRAPENDKGKVAMSRGAWVWKPLLVIPIYVIIYFTFGYFIAWKSPAVRAYYGGSEPQGFLTQVIGTLRDSPWLLPLQAGRAVLWTVLGIVIIRMLKRSWWEAGLIVALLFSILMNSQLLIPNPFMPQEVRMVHLLETATSNFLFGCLLVWVLSLGSNSARQFRTT